MAFGLSGSLSACFMYIFALLCVIIERQIKMLACLLACLSNNVNSSTVMFKLNIEDCYMKLAEL